MKFKRLALCFGILIISFSSIALTGIVLAQTAEPQPEPTPENPEIITLTQISPTNLPDENSLRAELLLFEQAYNSGPEAVIALRDSLSREALDILADEIHAAEAQLAERIALAQPRAPQAPISPEEELLQQEAVREQTVNNRARALASLDDPNEGLGEPLSFTPQTAAPDHVAADLTVGNGCTYATIDAAIQAAQPGDRLLLEGDLTFAENITINKDITLEGGYNGCASGSTNATTIDGTNTYRVIEIAPALSVTLKNLNLINGNTALDGGAIRLSAGGESGSLILDTVDIHHNTAQWGGGIWGGIDTQIIGTNVSVYSNTATTYGGGVRLYGGQATFSDSNIYYNTAPYGGGVYASKHLGHTPQLNLPTYADIYNNEATTSGGGLHFSEGYVTISNCSDISTNSSEYGGGATLITSTLTMSGDCSEIQYNETTGDGGGIYAQGSTINIEDSAEIYYNTAGNDGGGLYLDNSELWSDKAVIRFNEAGDYGGGIFAINNSDVDMDLGAYACLGTRCSQLSNNTTINYGGGIYAVDSDVDLRQIFIEDNIASLGGGVYANNSSVEFYNNLFAENDATSGTGDALRLYTNAEAVGNGNTFAYNDFAGTGNGQAVAIYNANFTLGCSIIWGHTTSISEGGTNTTAVTYSDIQLGFSGTGNINADPQFVSIASDDYHLSSSSPAIDQCASPSSMYHDFDNEARPIRQTSDATPYDMGADEYSFSHVGLNGNGCAYGTIAQAVEAADDGATIEVASGTFYENVVMEGDKSVTITGGYDSNCTTADAGTTIINGSTGTGSVFSIDGITAVLSKLDITEGNTSYGGGIELQNAAQVTLDNTRVHDNQAFYGGGIYIDSNSALTLTNNSDVDHNTATILGGGIRIYQGQFNGADNDSDISYNTAAEGGGIAVAASGLIYLNNSDLYQNQATDAQGRGGGVLLESGSVMDIDNSSYIYYLNQAYNGGGLYADASTINMNRATFRQNIADNYGGAIFLQNSILTATTNSNIGQAGSSLANEAIMGAGLYVLTSTVNFDGKIINNIAQEAGAGIYAYASTLDLNTAQVGGINLYESNQISGIGFGAGIYLDAASQATLQNSVVTSNTLQTTGAGGGLYVNNSNVTLIDSRVERHTAPSFNGRGAGIYASGSHVTLDNSQILSNTAELDGGGIRLYASAPTTLTMMNDSIIRNNESLTVGGGGIAATGDSRITIADATLHRNTAATDGGGIFVNGGTLNFTGGLTFHSNNAGDNGGGVAAINNANVNFDLQSYGLVYNNRASTDGGAFYLSNNQPVNLNVTGNSIYIYANIAGNHGGAAYVDSNASLTTQGTVNFDRNFSTNGHGGAIYVDAGGTLSLDADGASIPTLWDNHAHAGNGGAIYAATNAVVRCNQAVFGKEEKGNISSIGSGGSLYLDGSSFESNNCTFVEGQAALNGGAIAAYNASVVIATDESVCNPAETRCSDFVGNIADSDGDNTGYGGAIYSEDSHVDIEQTTLHDNEAARGGALYHKGSTVQNAHTTLENTLIYSNTVSEEYGAGVRTVEVHITATHVTLANNMGGAAFSPSSSEAWVTNSIAWGNSHGGFVRTYVYTDCNIDQSATVGLDIDPEFVAAGADEDYHLAETSPAIDACLIGLDEDLDGVARPEGDAYDMGAYEFFIEDYYIYLPAILK